MALKGRVFTKGGTLFHYLNGYQLLKEDFAPRGHCDQNLLQINIHTASSWLHRASMISNTFIVQLTHTTLKK